MSVPAEAMIGLAGSEDALRRGLRGGLGAIDAGVNRSLAMLRPFIRPGRQSTDLMAAYAGALGPEAQEEAFANFVDSPGQEWLRERAERGVLRNASAIGGLGGGNVRRELQREAMGMAQQDFANQYARLAGLSGMGQNTALNAAGMVGNAAGDASRMLYGAGRDIAGGRTRAGEMIAGQISDTSSALANLARAGASDVTNLYGRTGTNLANLLAQSGQAQGGAQAQAARLLAQIASGAGAQYATGIRGLPGVQETRGNLENVGNLASGIGGFVSAIPALAQLSDESLKTNIRKIGELPSGLPWYSWDWTPEGRAMTGEVSSRGVLAGEAKEYFPDSVHRGPDGYLRVDYSRIG